jgi:hypothetical protein
MNTKDKKKRIPFSLKKPKKKNKYFSVRDYHDYNMVVCGQSNFDGGKRELQRGG